MLFIRVDANKKIGIGHMMRCLSIAEEAVKQGVDSTFIVSDEESKQIIDRFGFSTICLNSKWNNMNEEIDILLRTIFRNKIRKLIVDSYYVTKEYIKIVGRNTTLIYLGDLKYYAENIDCIINYNNYYYKFNYDNMFKNKNTKLLLGTKYFPIRSEFFNRKSKVKKDASNLLITAGGNDMYNVTGKLLDYFINKKNEKNIHFDIVVGSLSDNIEFLKTFEDKYDNIKLHINTNNMAQLMIKSDIAISAGGTTLYELCACGVPTICYAFVDNQLDSINEFSDNGIMISIGDIRDKQDVYINLIYEKVQLMKNNYNIRKKMSNMMQHLVDDKGSYRIVKEINTLIPKIEQ
ncbi:UDP-2,4-diacetamido-2,4,6-trideoxy-beta-L-altropyranose hydrolase [Clostridium sporogenes]|uniref:UDP-2,4-diacetamido-2,4, 6-trideoxy-beta-L-altropyranose hydrolase n=1 Tax=Clostridium TaxID=1485 RepID=UPI0013D80D1A|nr:UDP-2,4-diacetamido-2,4,6-trideoxy-beta-L-altropyranose hydrolase [Clostridium sporogenes]EJP6470959.1 UDP-2,4-diacetamido-2,4,6-trideoxy-beta-L-altropyranose hydrolase [Clostridium botulinum]NFV12940.1 UDP-2,4-diacetamido-2,4,6-trideoxy-beta-L-altropyranose hydrolase [Clostridium sporogenes]